MRGAAFGGKGKKRYPRFQTEYIPGIPSGSNSYFCQLLAGWIDVDSAVGKNQNFIFFLKKLRQDHNKKAGRDMHILRVTYSESCGLKHRRSRMRYTRDYSVSISFSCHHASKE